MCHTLLTAAVFAAPLRTLLAYHHAKLRMFLVEHKKHNLTVCPGATPPTLDEYVISLAQDANPNENVRFLARLKPYLDAYVGFYTAIRTGNWALRNACIERLAVLIFAYARPKYMDIVAQAMVSKVMMPRKLLAQFEQGEWTVSFKGNPGANVAVDEALEMGANR